MNQLQFLKNEGHKLLDEYIALDTHRGKKEKTHAYRKLETKLKQHHKAHFAMMTTEAEVLHAISRLNDMIKKRKNKLEMLGFGKIKFAPNIREIQKNIVFTKVKEAE